MNRPASELPLLSKGAKPMNPDGITNLEHAVNDVYEAIVDEDDDYELDEDAVWLREQRSLNKATHWLKKTFGAHDRISAFLLCYCVFHR